MSMNTFERKEIKFLVTAAQRKALEKAFPLRMKLDAHGESTICNIYYDTLDFRLIRRSIEKPVYKEKLRLRSYGQANADSTTFLELKKKYKGIVYKRRIELPEKTAVRYMNGGAMPTDSQIMKEIDYCKQFYGGLVPAVYLAYDRTAYFSTEDENLRITFDRNIRFRTDHIDLTESTDGYPLILNGTSLMEIKAAGAIPLWIVDILSRYQIRQVSFSKYGTAYEELLTGETDGKTRPIAERRIA